MLSEGQFLELARSKYKEIAALEGIKDFYTYEKQFEELWVELGRSVLEQSISEAPKDRRKKKRQLTRFGTVEIHKAHGFSAAINGFQISPYMQELFLHAGVGEAYGKCEQVLHTFLRIEVSGMQVYRVTDCYGAMLEEQYALDNCAETLPLPLKADEVLYAQVDGTMMLTRTEGWKEAKQGRLFRESDCLKASGERGWIKHSRYEAYLGESKAFTRRFEPQLDRYGALKERLVFISDGAPWIGKWIEEAYPGSLHILDGYHAVERLGGFAQLCFTDKQQREQWMELQKSLLWESGVQTVLDNLGGLCCSTSEAEKGRKDLVRYYQSNQRHMDYRQYRSIGAGLIGSGAIEAAHRNLIHKRMKLSGQRWTMEGAQHLLNLRCAKMSEQWNKVVQLISSPPAKAA